MTRVRVAAFAELAPGRPEARWAGEHALLLLRRGEAVSAFANRCPHLGLPLSEGTVDGDALACRYHGWRFELPGGRGINPATACLRAFPCLVDGGEVYVDVPEAPAVAERDRVGPVLSAVEASRPVVKALQELNPGARIEDRGAYLRVSVSGRCLLTREAVERHAGTSFELPADLERIMPAFKGRFRVDSARAEWSAE